ncbi:hypothetical protein ACWGBX_08635 [Streptomyces sp. NPDC055037]
MYNRIVVTVQATNISPAWIEQLVDGGRLVVPLRMRGMTRTVAFVRHCDRLVSDGFELCGFVPMQGIGENHVRLVLLHDTVGEEVGLRLNGHPEPDAETVRAALVTPPVKAWSGVTLAGNESIEHLRTVFDNLPLLTGKPAARTRGLVSPISPHRIPALVDGGTFAYRTVRATDDPDRFELGVTGHGPYAKETADRWSNRSRCGTANTSATAPTSRSSRRARQRTGYPRAAHRPAAHSDHDHVAVAAPPRPVLRDHIQHLNKEALEMAPATRTSVAPLAGWDFDLDIESPRSWPNC